MKLRFFNLKKNWSVKNFGWSVTLVFFWRWFHFCNYFRPIMAGSMPEIEFVVFGQPIGGHVAWWRDRYSPDMAKSPDRGTVARSATVPYCWIDSSTWTPSSWSVFLRSTRTNNDVERWHLRFNRQGRPSMLFYMMIELLHREASYVEQQVQLVSDEKLRRRQRKEYVEVQKKLFKYWAEFEKGTRSAQKLLSVCSNISLSI